MDEAQQGIVKALRTWVEHEEYRDKESRESRIRRFGADISEKEFYGPQSKGTKKPKAVPAPVVDVWYP